MKIDLLKGVSMETILIKDASFVICDEKKVIEDGAVYVEDNKIADVGKSDELKKKYKADIIIDASKKAVMPGLIDCHCHVGQVHNRGMIWWAATTKTGAMRPKDKFDVLDKWIWPGYYFHTSETTYDVELAGLIEMIKSGTTTHLDCHIFPDSMAKAGIKSGLRKVLCPQVQTRWKLADAESPEDYLKLTDRIIREYNGAENGRIRVKVHPHWVFDLETEYHVKCAEIAKKYDVGIGIHMAEDLTELEIAKERVGKGPVEYLYDIGVLGPKTIGFHCVWLNDKEIKLFKETGTSVAHCPRSNMYAGFGVARALEYLEQGIAVGLGTDSPQLGYALDLFDEMKVSYLHNVAQAAPDERTMAKFRPAIRILPEKIFAMATRGGAKALNLEKEVGILEKGKKADMIIVDLKHPKFYPPSKQNIIVSMTMTANGSDVDTTIVDGKILMENRNVKALDEATILEKAKVVADEYYRVGPEKWPYYF